MFHYKAPTVYIICYVLFSTYISITKTPQVKDLIYVLYTNKTNIVSMYCYDPPTGLGNEAFWD